MSPSSRWRRQQKKKPHLSPFETLQTRQNPPERANSRRTLVCSQRLQYIGGFASGFLPNLRRQHFKLHLFVAKQNIINKIIANNRAVRHAQRQSLCFERSDGQLRANRIVFTRLLAIICCSQYFYCKFEFLKLTRQFSSAPISASRPSMTPIGAHCFTRRRSFKVNAA